MRGVWFGKRMPLQHRPMCSMHPGNARDSSGRCGVRGRGCAKHVWRRGHPQCGVVGGAAHREYRTNSWVTREHEVTPLSGWFTEQHGTVSHAAEHQLSGTLANGSAFGEYGRIDGRRDNGRGTRRSFTGELSLELRATMFGNPVQQERIGK